MASAATYAGIGAAANSLSDIFMMKYQEKQAKKLQTEAEQQFQQRLIFEARLRAQQQAPTETTSLEVDPESGDYVDVKRRGRVNPDLIGQSGSAYQEEEVSRRPHVAKHVRQDKRYPTPDTEEIINVDEFGREKSAGVRNLYSPRQRAAGLSGGSGRARGSHFTAVADADGKPIMVDLNQQPINPDTGKPWVKAQSGRSAANRDPQQTATAIAALQREMRDILKNDLKDDQDAVEAAQEHGMLKWDVGKEPNGPQPLTATEKRVLARKMALSNLGYKADPELSDKTSEASIRKAVEETPIAGLADTKKKSAAPKDAAVIAEAKQAIASGKSKAAVLARLKSMGYSDEQLQGL